MYETLSQIDLQPFSDTDKSHILQLKTEKYCLESFSSHNDIRHN